MSYAIGLLFSEKKYRLYVNSKYMKKLLDYLYCDLSAQKLKRKYEKYLLYKALLIRNN
jgi:hypothetical protein